MVGNLTQAPQSPGVDPLEVIIVGRLMKEAEHGDTKGRTLKARSKHASIALAELLIAGGLALLVVWDMLRSNGGKS